MTKEGDTVKNMHAFCATHDKLADWVRCSILEVDILGKRANIVDFWIRVAEVRWIHGYAMARLILINSIP
jgi:son of sevenless